MGSILTFIKVLNLLFYAIMFKWLENNLGQVHDDMQFDHKLLLLPLVRLDTLASWIESKTGTQTCIDCLTTSEVVD